MHDGISLRYRDVGDGPAVIFQHGLGGDEAQVASVFPDAPPVRRITLECRGNGASEFGPVSALLIATFADDVLALADHLGLVRAVIGGISLGAAIALRLAVSHPGRFGGLVLARPAWVCAPGPENMAPYGEVGSLLGRFTPDEAARRFQVGATATRLAREAPDNLASLLSLLRRTDGQPFGRLLTAIAADGPGVTEGDLRNLRLRTLVLGNAMDFAHPIAYARRLADLIPDAQFVELPLKATDRSAFDARFRAAVADFLGTLP